ncbi:MAG: sugar phosphate isomerase/epimerase [Planctomycetes bacterium]|nr:sugar phosphate isomerase/epimerase [Planctomycetota bacterium]NOG52884.1 sugar phosphate isomerase/epimerase [Planctomycetota bacterium]
MTTDDQRNPICFSAVACPTWPTQRVIEAAGEYGYDGIELRTLGPGGAGLASDPALTDPDKTRRLFDDAGVPIACLATSLSMHYRKPAEIEQAIRTGRSYIDLAVRLGCPRIRTFGYHIYPGEQRHTGVQRVATQYSTLMAYAEEHEIEVVVENAGSFSRAKELWQLSRFVEHPMFGICWNVANAASVGEGPGISVTTLNSRIRYAKLKDLIVGEGAGFVPLGEGTVELERFVELMRGIGFDGWFCVEWDKAWLPALADADEVLPVAIKLIREWMRPRFDKKGNRLSKFEGPFLEVEPAAAKK